LSAPPAEDFTEVLPFRGRILVRRLESFGDIVVGFSMSQLALQLGLPKVPQDLTNDPLRYFLFFLTFALIAVSWTRYHRMLTTAFAPHRLDLALAFAYLAFIALLPYALYANVRLAFQADGARYGFAAYTLCLLGSSAAAALISRRALGRVRGFLADYEVVRLRQRTAIEAGLVVIFFTALLVDCVYGIAGSPVLIAIPIWLRFVRSRFRVPGWSQIYVHGVDDARAIDTPGEGED
jgi:uncharacterized membrane protein